MKGRVSLVVVAAVIFGALFLAGCSRGLETIPSDTVPYEIRAGLEETQTPAERRPEKVVWHVYTDNDRLTLAAASYLQPIPTGEKFKMYRVYYEDKATGKVFIHNFQDSKRGAVSVSGGLQSRILGASGLALDKRIVKIVGKTTLGREAEADLFGGFWSLQLSTDDRNEQWQSIIGVSESGRTLYDLDLAGAGGIKVGS